MRAMIERPNLRAEPRIAVSCRGTLSLGDRTVPCDIQNMCTRGFLIRANKELPVGQSVKLCCDLDASRHICCLVQVRHVNRNCLGAKIIEITDDERVVCLRYLEERRGPDVAPPPTPQGPQAAAL